MIDETQPMRPPRYPCPAGVGPRLRKAQADLAWALAENTRLREELARVRTESALREIAALGQAQDAQEELARVRALLEAPLEVQP